MHKSDLSKIRAAITRGLPGWSAQKLFSPIHTEKYRQPKPDSKQAGVVALLYPAADDMMHLVYIKRTSNHPDDKHGGQISFPGGQYESGDKDIRATALRELQEELGLDPSQIEILGALTSLYIYVSDFQVYPFLAYIDHTPDFDIEIAEVAYPIAIPLKTLLEQSSLTKDIHIREMTIKNAPYYDLNGEVLWGATAMMTSEILELVKTQ